MIWGILGLIGLIAIGLIGGGLWLMRRKHPQKGEDPSTRLGPETKLLPLPSLASDYPPLSGPYPARPSLSFPLTRFEAGTTLAFGSVFASFALIFGCATSATVTLPAWQTYSLFKNTGVMTEAVVIDRPFNPRSRSGRYQITYQYTAPLPKGGSQQFTTTTSVRSSTYDSLALGAHLPILYVPTNPGVSRLQSEFEPPFVSLVWSVFPFLLMLFGLGIVIWGGQELKEVLALEDRGQIIEGVLFDRWVAYHRRPPCVAYYFDLMGQPYERARVVRAEFNGRAYHTYQVGDRVQIRYLPENPKICRLVL